VSLLVVALLVILLFGGLGVAVSPLFWIVLLLLLVGGGVYTGRGRWYSR
jgi:hypothetical protein